MTKKKFKLLAFDKKEKAKFSCKRKIIITDFLLYIFIGYHSHEKINKQNVKANIINIIDQRVFKLTPFFLSYTLSKTGLYTLTKTSAMSLAPNIRVNGIAPGPTIKNKRQSLKHFKKQYLSTLLKKNVDTTEICSAIKFLITNKSITGQVIAIDSGQNLSWKTPDIIESKE